MLCLFVGTLVALLLAEGLTVHGTGASGTPPPATANRVRALESNAALWVAGPNGRLVPRQERIGKRVALTFDDGPDPTGPRRSQTRSGGWACRRPSSPSGSTSSRTRV